MRRSAARTVTDAESASFAGSVSVCVTAAAAATFTSVRPSVSASTVATIESAALSPAAIVPTSHRPAPGAYVPRSGTSDCQVSPAGSGSATCTPVAESGPAFRTVTVNVTASPASAPAASTVLTTARSTASTGSASVSASSDASGSPRPEALTPANVVRDEPAVPGSTVTVRSSVAGVAEGSAPTVHAPLPALNAPCDAASPWSVRPAGSAPVTTRPRDASGPWLSAVQVSTTVSPSLAREVSADTLTAMSAARTTAARDAVLFPGDESSCAEAVIAAAFVSVPPAVPAATIAVTSSVWEPAIITFPAVQSPVPGS
jgi:hypothetical protein